MNNDALLANRFALAYQDFDDARRYLAVLHDLTCMNQGDQIGRYDDHREAALTAAIVAYGRPFKNSYSDGNASPKLNSNELDSIQEAENAALHDLLLDLRDKVVAHGDWKYRNTNLAAGSPGVVIRRISVPDIERGIDCDKFLNLVLSLKNEVLARSHTLDSAASKGAA